MADLIVKSTVKESLDEMNVAADFYVALDGEVTELLEDAARRAEANDRNTVQPYDFYFPSDHCSERSTQRVKSHSRVGFEVVLPDDLPVDREKLLTWRTECWQCDEQTPVVWPRDDHLDTPIGGVLADYDTPVERVFSNTVEKEVWGNVCQHCDAYLGNHYIRKEALDKDPPLVECPNCSEKHEWRPDEGLGGAFSQGWVSCPEYGDVPVGDPRED